MPKPGPKVKLGQLVQLAGNRQNPGALSKLAGATDYSYKITRKIAKLAKAVSEELEVYNAAQNKLVEKYGTKLEGQKGKGVTPGDEGFEPFMEEYNALLGEEVKLDCSIVDLPFGPEGFSAGDLLSIEDFKRLEVPPQNPFLHFKQLNGKLVAQLTLAVQCIINH